MALGTTILVVTYFIPIIGFITLIVAYLFGMGMILNRGKQLLYREHIIPKVKAKKMNRDWHQKNKMPANTTDEQRAKWHIEHLKNCDCRKPTLNIQKLIDKYQTKKS